MRYLVEYIICVSIGLTSTFLLIFGFSFPSQGIVSVSIMEFTGFNVHACVCPHRVDVGLTVVRKCNLDNKR